MYINELKTRPPFNELFEIKPEVMEAIAENMRRWDFDNIPGGVPAPPRFRHLAVSVEIFHQFSPEPPI